MQTLFLEKLEEIKIPVKSHMSLLEEDELNRLYKHIGIVSKNRVEGSDDGVNVDQQEQVDNQVRKNIPRIIRKTEIIIHDDDYEREIRDRNKNKNTTNNTSNKKNFVRTSSSTDGLMAGLARGNDHGSNTRKQNPEHAKTNERDWSPVKKKGEEPKITPEPVDDLSGMNRGDRIRRPMDNILSIKKVSSREEREKQSLEENETKQDSPVEATQNEEVKKAENKAEAEKTENRNTIGIQKESVSAGAEKSEDHMAINTQVIQQANTDKAAQSMAAGTIVNEGHVKVIDKQDLFTEKPSGELDKAENQPEVSMKETREDSRQEIREARTEDSDRNRNRGSVAEQRPQSPREDRERGPRMNQQAGHQEIDAQNRGARYDNREGNRDGGQNRSFNREGSQGGGYNRDGGQRTSFNREGSQGGGFNREGGQGGYNREGGQGGGYNRDGGQKTSFNREGGQSGSYNREGGPKP